jgi:hypothetical protein
MGKISNIVSRGVSKFPPQHSDSMIGSPQNTKKI